MTEIYCDLMLSGTGWGMHKVAYSGPQCTGDNFINSFIVLDAFWDSSGSITKELPCSLNSPL